MIRELTSAVLPSEQRDQLRNWWARHRTSRPVDASTGFGEDEFRQVLAGRLGLKRGDVVFIHSSIDGMNLAFSPGRVLQQLLEIVGPEGTLVFPTYPRGRSHEVLRRGDLFDLRKSPSFSGLLSEAARRHRSARRSLHPTKSVCAIGPLAEHLVEGHERCHYPYAAGSPYEKLVHADAKLVGLGVTTQFLSFVHVADDLLHDAFPVSPYYPDRFTATCRDAAGELHTVHTYAHHPLRSTADIPAFLARRVSKEVASDFTVRGSTFFIARARPLLPRLIELARQGHTVYPWWAYRPRLRWHG